MNLKKEEEFLLYKEWLEWFKKLFDCYPYEKVQTTFGGTMDAIDSLLEIRTRNKTNKGLRILTHQEWYNDLCTRKVIFEKYYN
jgi:hypothetical protein